jgi:hypothetical protein
MLLGFPLWPSQRERLAEIERGPRLHVWALGRRSSKTTLKALVGLWCCLLRPELLERLRPGERGYAVAVATNLRQARLITAAAASIVEASPLLQAQVEAVTDDEIRFSNSTGFAAFPCTSRGGRGWPIFALLLDEFAHFLSESEGPQAADSVWQALVPATAQFGDLARIIVGSTPWGSAGLFADLHFRASSGQLPDAVAVRMPTSAMNPTITPEFLALEEARDPEAFRSEYLAEFVGSGGAFFDPDRVRDAVADRGELPPEYGLDWVAGLDPAFSSDPFGLAIVGRDPADSRRLVLGVARRWKPQRRKAETFEEGRLLEDAVLDEVAALCVRYRARVITDQYRARGVVEYLRRKGVGVSTVEAMTAASKTAAFSALRARFNLEGLELYEEPQLLAELRRVTTKYTAGQAAVRVARVGDSHGDMAQALALAVFEHDRSGMALAPAVPAEPRERDERDRSPLADLDRVFGDGSGRRSPRWCDPRGGTLGKVF